MCIAAIAWDTHPRWRLVIAANRDELHARPAAPLAEWPGGLVAGRDLLSGGTWLGVQGARCVLVTNFRAEGFPQAGRPSRGALVTNLLAGADPLAEPLAAYNPFNLFHTDGCSACILGNYPAQQRRALPPGIHGLSNGPFAEPWPKTRQLTAAMADWLAGKAEDFAPLLAALADRTPPPASADDAQPEAPFSAVFIANPLYGTRCSTVVAIDHAGQTHITERRFDAAGTAVGDTTLAITRPAP